MTSSGVRTRRRSWTSVLAASELEVMNALAFIGPNNVPIALVAQVVPSSNLTAESCRLPPMTGQFDMEPLAHMIQPPELGRMLLPEYLEKRMRSWHHMLMTLAPQDTARSEEHTSELQSPWH